mgnify:FL=1
MERSKAVEVTLRVRPEVAKFAELMEQKLRANDHKGHWRGSSLSYLIARLREECGELIDAILYEEDSAPGHITEEAADVANFAMFIADAAGALEVDTEDMGSTVQLNKNMYSVRDKVDMPMWKCPACKGVSILNYFRFCPTCGRRIEWVDYGLDGPKWIEEIRSSSGLGDELCTDPFSEVNDRYRLYCLAHGADSPEEMERIEADATGPGKPIFLLWATENMYEWKRLKGLKRDHVMTEADHSEFDSWLEAKVLLDLGGNDQ